jgi:hypothetical protein
LVERFSYSADLRLGFSETAGPSASLRSGRDDKWEDGVSI